MWVVYALRTLLLLSPLDVALGVPPVVFPGTAVIFELQLVHHDDAFLNRAHLRAFVTTGTDFVVHVIQPIIRRIETLIGAV
jgi:hypothetical protein